MNQQVTRTHSTSDRDHCRGEKRAGGVPESRVGAGPHEREWSERHVTPGGGKGPGPEQQYTL